MSPTPLERYRRLERHLVHMRWLHGGEESSQEEGLIENMAEAWEELSEQEQQSIRSEGPKTVLPTSTATHRRLIDVADNSGPHRVMED